MKIFLLLLITTFFSYASGYDFKTIDATGAPSAPLKKTLEILDIDPQLAACEALSLLEEKYGRKPSQERHELDVNQTIQKHQETLITLLNDLGMMEAILPSQKVYDFIVIHGATIERMRERFNFFLFLLSQKKIHLLPETELFIITGDRELFPHEDILSSPTWVFRKGWGAPAQLPKTEGEAARVIIDQLIEAPDLRARFKVLVAPKRYDEETQKWLRPHTGNTIEILLSHLENSTGKKFLFISNNPYVPYQNAIVTREFLDRSLTATLETVGPKANEKITAVEIDNLRNTLQRELEVWDRLQKKPS